MKILKNKHTNACGIETPFYAIIKNLNTGNYCYYIQVIGNRVNHNIYNGIKAHAFNKYTLTLLSILHSLMFYFAYMPIAIILFIPHRYFDGARNFIRDKAWQNNVRFFNWCNFIVIPLLIVWLILK
jgi:hypothetical protein